MGTILFFLFLICFVFVRLASLRRTAQGAVPTRAVVDQALLVGIMVVQNSRVAKVT